MPERCRMNWNAPGVIGELEGAALTPRTAPSIYSLIWEYRRICAANVIDRE